MEITCIMCPVGCNLKIKKVGEKIVVEGNNCPRGATYGEQEAILPKRMITTIKQYRKKTISLKLSKPIAKDLIKKCLQEIASYKITKKINIGDILIKNILDQDVDVIVTNIND